MSVEDGSSSENLRGRRACEGEIHIAPDSRFKTQPIANVFFFFNMFML